MVVDNIKETEEELKVNENRYRSLYQNAQVGMFTTRVSDGKIIECNDRGLELFGFSSLEEFANAGLAVDFYVNPEDRKRVRKALEETGKVNRFQVNLNRKDGTEFWAEFSASLRPDLDYMDSVVIDITETKKTEDELVKQEEHYRSLFQNARVGLFRTRISDGVLIDCNEAGVEMLGYETIDEAKAKFVATEHYTDPDKRNMMIEDLKKGQLSRLEMQGTKADGSSVWIEMSGNLYPEEGYLDTVVFDIDERKEAVEALRKSEERYRRLFMGVPVAIYRTDIESGRVLECNQRGAELAGYDTPEEVIAEYNPVDHYSNPEDRQKIHSMLVEHGEVRYGLIQAQMTNKDGELLWCEFSAKIYPELGINEFVVADITDKKEAIDKLLKSEERYRTLVQSLHDLVFVIDENGRFSDSFVSDKSLLYVPPEVFLGRHVSEVLPLDVSEEILSKVNIARTSGQVETLNYSLDTDNGLQWFSAKISLHDNGSDVVAVVRDITEQKEAEEELKDAQDLLVRNEKMAVLGRVSGGIGHELRNPLAAIKNAVYYLKMVLNESDDDLQETLDILDNEVSTSEMIITSLLDYARPKDPVRKKAELKDLVQEALSRVKDLENIEVVREFDSDIPILLVDPVQITRVIINIVRNAAQAMSGSGALTIKGSMDEPDWLSLSISDTGVGMSEEAMSHLFEPLYTTKAKGIGLGLVIIKAFVEKHGGKIEVDSEVGKGSTFTVKLPVSRKEVE